MSNSTPHMTWTKDAEMNLLMCLWQNETTPKRRIESDQWTKITEDFARVQGRSIGTKALQTRVNLMKNRYANATGQPVPVVDGDDAHAEEAGNDQALVGAGGSSHAVTSPHQAITYKLDPNQIHVPAGGAPGTMTNQYQDQPGSCQAVTYGPNSCQPASYGFHPHPANQGPMAHSGYTYAHAHAQHAAVSRGYTGYGDTSMYGPRLLGDAGGNTEGDRYMYPTPPM